MEFLALPAFVFALMGVIAYARVDKLTKQLKEKGVLDEDDKTN